MNPILLAYQNRVLSFEEAMSQLAFQAGLASKTQGAVYTPAHIVSTILERLAVTPSDTVIDPAVGRGAFIIPLLARLSQSLTAPQMTEWMHTSLNAYDVDADALEDARALTRIWFEHRYASPLDERALTGFQQGDTLTLPRTRRASVALGNPPYIRFQNLSETYRTWLADTYTSCAKGNVDIYYAFLEWALACADRTGFIVPNGFLTTQSAKALRALLIPKVEHIHHYGAHRVFPSIGTYTCLLFTSPNPLSPTFSREGDPTIVPFEGARARPANVRSVKTGIATLCDKAFLFERTGDTFTSPLTGKTVEARWLRPLIKATKLRGDLSDWTQFVLCPYTLDGTPVAETVFDAYPLTKAHLEAVKPLLMARDKGKTERYPAWYAYGRAQGLNPLNGPRALIVPAMMGGHSQPRLVSLSDLTPWNNPLILSGYAIDDPSDADVAAFLSPNFAAHIARIADAKPGKEHNYYNVASWMIKSYLPMP